MIISGNYKDLKFPHDFENKHFFLFYKMFPELFWRSKSKDRIEEWVSLLNVSSDVAAFE